MADGSYRDIEKVSIGDRVMSRDVTKQETVSASVLAVESPLRSTYFIISLEDGSEIRVTGEHPLYSCKNEAVGWGAVYPLKEQNQAGLSTLQLEVGDTLFKEEWVCIHSIQMVAENVQTYNLKDVGDTHSFFANGVLVHNKGEETEGNGE
jgi:intein/homing endonuclease